MPLLRVLILLAIIFVFQCAAWSTGEIVPISVQFLQDQHQSRHRSMSESLVPRFGLHRIVSLPAFHYNAVKYGDGLKVVNPDDIALEIENDDHEEQDELDHVAGLQKEHIYGEPDKRRKPRRRRHDPLALAIKFHFGPLQTHTPWIALARRPPQKAELVPTKTEALQRLTYLTITFHYRAGVFQEVTSVTYECRYTTSAHRDGGGKPGEIHNVADEGDITDSLTIEYIWKEDKKVDPESAITVVHVIALTIAFLLAMKITSAVSQSNLGKVLVVRDRAD